VFADDAAALARHATVLSQALDGLAATALHSEPPDWAEELCALAEFALDVRNEARRLARLANAVVWLRRQLGDA
jgi:hypothetical protein